LSTKPTLRPLDFQPVYYQGRQMWHLRDPLRLSELQLFLPPALAHLLTYLDGTRDPAEIRRAFSRDVGEEVDAALVDDTLAQLDRAFLLDNERSRRAREEMLLAFRRQGERPPALAGAGYPADPNDVIALFEAYGAQDDEAPDDGWRGRAVVSPHIDYQRGGPVYARVWRRAAASVADAELVLIFGTDHNGGLGTVTLTELPYSTPFGQLPAAPDVVRGLAQALGEENAFELELNHRAEHSVELSAVWLHYICHKLGRTPPPMVPILCGSFHHFVSNGHHPAQDGALNAFLQALRAASTGKKVLAVASVDLAHVGPAFGDPFAFNEARREALRASDRSLITAINDGDYDRFYDEIAAVGDRHHICGFSSTYLMLRYLQKVRGIQVAYEQCPADEQGASFVSICGLLLS
jgi:AmmeMemoRadiSam system protein B